MSQVKLSDIASKIGVSIATVSMALSGKGNISDELRNQILQLAKDMGYKKRVRSRISNLNPKCLAILSFMNYQWAYLGKFATPIYAQIEAISLKHGYYPIIIPITDSSTVKDLRETILQSQAMGIISIHFYHEGLFEQLEQMALPVVIVNNSTSIKSHHSVCVDDYQGAGDGTQYLINLGHKNILYMDYWRHDQRAVVIDRFFGFKRSMNENNIPFTERKRITIEIDEYTELLSSVRSAMRNFSETTAIFAHDDRLAIRIYTALKEEGVLVPNDISIIAPGDTLDYNLPYISPITTMKIDTNLLGSLAAELIIKHIEAPPKELVTLKVTQQLVDRGSCRSLI